MKLLHGLTNRYLEYILLLCLFFNSSTSLIAANDEGDQQQRINAIKAAYVLNIARYVTWPKEVYANHQDRLHLCIYRNNSYGQPLEAIRGKSIGKRRLAIIIIDHFKEVDDCEILFISPDKISTFSEDIQGDLQRPLLTIADLTESGKNGVSLQGVIVSLVRQNNRMIFEIDLAQAREVDLLMSSELLKLARIVGKDSP